MRENMNCADRDEGRIGLWGLGLSHNARFSHNGPVALSGLLSFQILYMAFPHFIISTHPFTLLTSLMLSSASRPRCPPASAPLTSRYTWMARAFILLGLNPHKD